MIPDMEEYYAARLAGNRDYGLFYTYAETVAELDALHAQYPNITTAKYSIGTSIEGRTIWAMKVSDNPNVDENEPEVGFDGVHHAREPITINVLLETIRYLCENYGVDPEVTFLVDNREIFFVPIVNPDGYVYNEQTYPNGGGMWRKNRHAPVGGCYGVDLNRNYPYQWGGEGSSDRALRRDLPRNVSRLGARAGGAHELHQSAPVRHLRHLPQRGGPGPLRLVVHVQRTRPTTRSCARSRRRSPAWPATRTASRPRSSTSAAGTSMDWLYGEQQTKPKIFGFSTEVGGSDFWPTQAEVPGLVAENIPKNIYLMKVAGGYPALTAATLSGGDGDGLPDPGETLSLVATLQNQSPLKPALGVAVTLMTDDPYVQLNDAQRVDRRYRRRRLGQQRGRSLLLHGRPELSRGAHARDHGARDRDRLRRPLRLRMDRRRAAGDLRGRHGVGPGRLDSRRGRALRLGFHDGHPLSIKCLYSEKVSRIYTNSNTQFLFHWFPLPEHEITAN